MAFFSTYARSISSSAFWYFPSMTVGVVLQSRNTVSDSPASVAKYISQPKFSIADREPMSA